MAMTDDDYKKLDSRMEIEIRSVMLALPGMLADVLTRVAHYKDTAKKVTITCNAPERDGDRMYIMVIEYVSGGSITVGALRRTQDAETEYHS